MIQQSHLTEWQIHAPWPKPSQTEQDLRLSRGVAAIFGDEVLREHLAMRGGTVLHKGHLAPAARYSEDIDLVLIKAMNAATLDKSLRRVLTPVLGQPSDGRMASVRLTIRNVLQPSKILRTAFRFVPLELHHEETIKVEVNLNENASLYPLVDVALVMIDEEGEHVRFMARSYDINELLGTKMRALMQRQQGRDLFDLAHAWQLSEAGKTPHAVDSARVMQAFTWYLDREGSRFSAKEAHKRLDAHLREPMFRSDMDSLLRPDLPAFNVDQAARVVREAYFRHLP